MLAGRYRRASRYWVVGWGSGRPGGPRERPSTKSGGDALAALARDWGLELPITAAVDRICNHGGEVGAEIERLLARPFREEGA